MCISLSLSEIYTCEIGSKKEREDRTHTLVNGRNFINGKSWPSKEKEVLLCCCAMCFVENVEESDSLEDISFFWRW